MEGGKKMNDLKTRIIIKTVLVLILSVTFLNTLFALYRKIGIESNIYNPLILSTYSISYTSDKCMNKPEVIYRDDHYEYSLPCISSYDTYLLWDDGTKELIKNALQNAKVDMDSLMLHGLKVLKNEI